MKQGLQNLAHSWLGCKNIKTMKTLILSNWSQNIAELHDLTAPNKAAYCKLHGYDFEDVEMDYGEHVRFLEIIRERLTQYDIVMHCGCDVIFTNFRVRIEDKCCQRCCDNRVIIAREHISWFPINNDVIIWPRGHASSLVLDTMIESSEVWLKYSWLWQHHLWNLMQEPKSQIKNCVRLVEAKEMNSTFQPFVLDQNKQCFRTIGPSSWQLGDWILHALDMPMEMRIQVIKWGLGFVGDGSWRPVP